MAQTAPETLILAEDEASMYLQATTQAVWSPKGQTPYVRAHPGREMTHFYGTLNLLTGEEIAQREDKMNAATTACHLEKLLATYPDVPLLLLWDRAPWHRGPAITQVLEANPRLEVLRFPTATPELNPQEHVWKTVRSAISHNHDQTKLSELADRFELHLSSSTFDYAFVDKFDFVNLCARFS